MMSGRDQSRSIKTEKGLCNLELSKQKSPLRRRFIKAERQRRGGKKRKKRRRVLSKEREIREMNLTMLKV